MTNSTAGFVNLHVHSEHSPLDSISRLPGLVKKVAADGAPAVAVTDHGTMGAAWRFAQLARKEGVKPIIGIEAYIALAEDYTQEPNRFDPKPQLVDRDDETAGDADEDEVGKVGRSDKKTKWYQHITLLAETKEGFSNLVAMVNESANSFKFHPLMDWQLMKQYHEGVIALTGCLGGAVLGPVAAGNMDEARANLDRIIDTFGHDNVYMEIMEHGIEKEKRALP